jgi:hypothetical protein
VPQKRDRVEIGRWRLRRQRSFNKYQEISRTQPDFLNELESTPSIGMFIHGFVIKRRAICNKLKMFISE